MSTVAILESDSIIPEATALGLLSSDQVDANREIWWGHKADFDFAALSVTTLAVNATVDNLVDTTKKATVGNASFGSITTVKGLTKTAGATSYITLPTNYDLLTLGTEPNFVMAFFLTQDAVVTASQALGGYIGSSASTSRQWGLISRDDGGITVTGFGMSASLVIPAAVMTLGVPHLISIHGKRTASGVNLISVWVDKTLIASGAGTYPFVDPATLSGDANNKPMFFRTYQGGFGSGWAGKLHCTQLIKVADSHDMSLWTAAEYDGNITRVSP